MSGPVRALARSALAAAAGTAVLLLASVLPTAKLALLCLASLGVVLVRMSCSSLWGALCYAATAALGLLLLPVKGVAALYAAFFGYYPLVKLAVERLSHPAARWVCKLAVFNAAALLLYFAARGLLAPELTVLPLHPALLLLMANVAFIVYDYALEQLILFYIRRLSGSVK